MHFAAFCAVVTKQQGKQLREPMTQTNHGSDPNKIIWTQSSGAGEGGEQTNSGSVQASEPSVKAS